MRLDARVPLQESMWRLEGNGDGLEDAGEFRLRNAYAVRTKPKRTQAVNAFSLAGIVRYFPLRIHR
jgi:hypothetical protein